MKTITAPIYTYSNPVSAVYATGGGGGAAPTGAGGAGGAAPTSSTVPFTGGANANTVGGFAVAAIAGVFAMVL